MRCSILDFWVKKIKALGQKIPACQAKYILGMKRTTSCLESRHVDHQGSGSLLPQTVMNGLEVTCHLNQQKST